MQHNWYIKVSTFEPNLIRWCSLLTHWGRVTPICVSKLTVIGSDNCLSPGRRQAIIWTNAGILLIGSLGTNFNDFFNRNSYIFTQENQFENVVWKMASILSRPQCVNSQTGGCYVYEQYHWRWSRPCVVDLTLNSNFDTPRIVLPVERDRHKKTPNRPGIPNEYTHLCSDHKEIPWIINNEICPDRFVICSQAK